MQHATTKRDKCLELINILDEEHRAELNKLIDDLNS